MADPNAAQAAGDGGDAAALAPGLPGDAPAQPVDAAVPEDGAVAAAAADAAPAAAAAAAPVPITMDVALAAMVAEAGKPMPPLGACAPHLLRVARAAVDAVMRGAPVSAALAAVSSVMAPVLAEDPGLLCVDPLPRSELLQLAAAVGFSATAPGAGVASGAGGDTRPAAPKAKPGAFPAAYARAGAAPPTRSTAAGITKVVREALMHLPAAALEDVSKGHLAGAMGGKGGAVGFFRRALDAARERCEEAVAFAVALSEVEHALCAVVPTDDEGEVRNFFAAARHRLIAPLARQGWAADALVVAMEDSVLRPLTTALQEAAETADFPVDAAAMVAYAAGGLGPEGRPPFDWARVSASLRLEDERKRLEGEADAAHLRHTAGVQQLRAERAAAVVHAMAGSTAKAGFRTRAQHARWCVLATVHDNACPDGALCAAEHPASKQQRAQAEAEAGRVFGAVAVLEAARTFFERVWAAAEPAAGGAAASAPNARGSKR